MATPQEKLAASLEALQVLQEEGAVAIRAGDLSRVHRERLLKAGFLREVMKGWYVPAKPDETAGDSTSWYASFWGFCGAYLNERFDSDWCLSPEQSLSIHAGNWSVPQQLVVRSPKGGNKPTPLPHGTALLDVRAALPARGQVAEADGLRLFSLPAALIACSPGYFRNNPTDARTALALIRSASDVLAPLLEGGHSIIAGRLAGAFRNISQDRIADEIVATMKVADYNVREEDPFENKVALPAIGRITSPSIGRIRLMWDAMRPAVLEHFPDPPARPNDLDAYMERVDGTYVTDAYHSLSIEGYRVSPELIHRVRSGTWAPDRDDKDRKHQDALAARGYYQAFQAVRTSVRKVLEGDNPGGVVDDDHGAWYREMFGPSVTAGIARISDLAGYRSSPVYIRRSKHVPPRWEAVRDAMPTFFGLLREEESPKVRTVLGHFVFVYIHPYVDGNGRMGRFLMNVMLASGGYPWTVVPVERRNDYMAALETASVGQDIGPFAHFLGQLVTASLAGKAVATVPDGES